MSLPQGSPVAWLGNLCGAVAETWRVVRDLRIIALVLAGSSLALTALDQGADVMRTLVDGANVSLLRWTPQPAFWRWIALFGACALTGVNAWYWAHLLYKSSGAHQRRQPPWYVHMRRVMGVTPLLAAALAMPISVEWEMWDVALGVGLFLAGAAALLRFFVARSALADRIPKRAQWLTAETSVLRTQLAGGDLVFIVGSLLVSLVVFFVFLIPDLRLAAAWALGPAAVVFLGAAGVIPGTSLLIWATRERRVPVVGLGLALFVASSVWNDNHAIRPLGETAAVRERLRLEDAYAAWAKGLGPSEPMVLVAAAGGASRAAYWTGSVLRALDQESAGAFSRRTFAISGVSGGALGAIGYAGWLSGRPAADADWTLHGKFLTQFFGDDYLSPALSGLLFPDLLQRFLPFALLPSRAQYLEQAWEEGWARAMGACGPGCGRADLMRGDFLDIWRDLLAGAQPSRWTPLVFSNGTHVQTGKRIITAPVKIGPDAFEDAVDFFDAFGRPVRASTAVLNSARFPVVSPAGRITGVHGTVGHVVDGGYFENGGLETAYDVARAVRRFERRNARNGSSTEQRPIVIVEISNDDQRSPAAVARRVLPDDSLPASSPDAYWRSPLLGEMTAIVGGLYATRGARGDLTAKRLSDTDRSGLGRASYFSFPLAPLCMDEPRPADGTCARVRRVSMSWLISMGSKFGMDVRLNTDPARIDALVAGIAPEGASLPGRLSDKIKEHLRKAVAASASARQDLRRLVESVAPEASPLVSATRPAEDLSQALRDALRDAGATPRANGALVDIEDMAPQAAPAPRSPAPGSPAPASAPGRQSPRPALLNQTLAPLR